MFFFLLFIITHIVFLPKKNSLCLAIHWFLSSKEKNIFPFRWSLEMEGITKRGGAVRLWPYWPPSGPARLCVRPPLKWGLRPMPVLPGPVRWRLLLNLKTPRRKSEKLGMKSQTMGPQHQRRPVWRSRLLAPMPKR